MKILATLLGATVILAGGLNASCQNSAQTFPAGTISGSYVAPPSVHPYIYTNKTRLSNFIVDSRTDPRKVAALTTLSAYVSANIGNAQTIATPYDGTDLRYYQSLFSVGQQSAAYFASQLALYAYLVDLNLGYTGSAGISAADARNAAQTVLYNWANTGFEINGTRITDYSQFTETSIDKNGNTVDDAYPTPSRDVPFDIGRGMTNYVAAQDLLLGDGTETSTQQTVISNFIYKMLVIVQGGANFRFSSLTPSCHRYDNQASEFFEALIAMARFTSDASIINTMAGTDSSPVLPWSFAQQIEGAIYGTNDTYHTCDNGPSTADYNFNLNFAAGEVIDRDRNDAYQPFGYTLGSLISLLQGASMLADAGYNAAGFVGAQGQTIQTAVDYYAYYFSNYISCSTVSLPTTANSYPDYAQYGGDVFTRGSSNYDACSSVKGVDDLPSVFILANNLYPGDKLINQAIATVADVAANYTKTYPNTPVVSVGAMTDILNVYAWEHK